jgi:hypothetical protein
MKENLERLLSGAKTAEPAEGIIRQIAATRIEVAA